jgi:hypothetical protein
MTWAAMDAHARSTYAASLDVLTGELTVLAAFLQALRRGGARRDRELAAQ